MKKWNGESNVMKWKRSNEEILKEKKIIMK